MVLTPIPSRASDPAALAAEVRALANEAYRSLHQPGTSATEIRALSRRVACLQSQVRGGRSRDHSDWLASLRKAVDDRLGGGASSTGRA